jgi:hypothetical protein
MVERRITYGVLVGKHEGNSPLERLGVDARIILKFILKEMKLEVMDWIDLARNRLY